MIALRGLHSALRPYAEYAVRVAHAYGVNPVITSVFRSSQEQAQLYDAYVESLRRGVFRTPGQPQYPANRPGDSAHNFGFAWDSWVPEHQQETWNAIRRWVGWDVLANDLIHAQLPGWRSYVS